MQISRRSFLVGLGAGVFTELPRTSLVFAQETPHNLISVADYGALPDGGDAGPGVRRAIAALPQRGGATLFFPPGRYHFRQSSGDAMLIEHIERLVLDGTGATLLFEGTTTPLRVRYCDSPLIHGFNIDSDRPQFSQGEVRAISPDARACQIRVNPEFPVTGREQVQAVGTYASGIPTESREVDSFYPVESVSLIDSQLLRLTFKWPQTQLSLGATVVLRHSMYDGCGIAIGYCRMPKLQNISIYAAAGMGVIGACNEDLYIERLRIQQRPGSRRLLSTCTDGFHNYNGIGKIVLKDCFFEATGDDCINVNTSYLIIIARLDARTALVRKADKSPFTERDRPLPNAPYTVVDRNTLNKISEASLIACDLGKEATFHFNSDLPKLQPGDLLTDNLQRAALTVSGCTFPGSRGRAVVAHNDVLIERCRFANQGNEAILLMADGRDSMEGPTCDGVRIFHNEIDNSYRKGPPSVPVPVGAIRLSARVPLGHTPGLVNHDIEIASNEIRGSSTAGIVTNYTNKLAIDSNRFAKNHGPAIVLNTVRNASLTNNVSTPPGGIVIDQSSRNSVVLKANIGLE